jgi:hypothetical protein
MAQNLRAGSGKLYPGEFTGEFTGGAGPIFFKKLPGVQRCAGQ